MKKYYVSPLWENDINSWKIALRAAGRTPQTIETRCEHLRRFARQIGAPNAGMVTRARLIDWVGAHDWAPETRRSMYASLKGFYGWALATDRVGDDITDCLPSVRAGIPAPRPADELTYKTALAKADQRTRVILRLAAEAGLRRAEISQIHANDFSPDLVGTSLKVHGKGMKVRFIPLTDSLAREVQAAFSPSGWLLPSLHGGHVTARWVGRLAARVLPAPFTLHTLRHRFATQVYEATSDLLTVQKLLGHSSVATTQRYVAVDRERMRAAVAAAAL